MNQVVLLNGSPKINEPSASAFLLDRLASRLDLQSARLFDLRILGEDSLQDLFRALDESDDLVIAAPLYHFALPAMLLELLVKYQRHSIETGPRGKLRVHAIINCAFPEVESCREPARVVKSFAHRIGAESGLAVLVSGGPYLLEMGGSRLMRGMLRQIDEAMEAMALQIRTRQPAAAKQFEIRLSIPRRLYYPLTAMAQVQKGKSNGLSRQQMSARP